MSPRTAAAGSRGFSLIEVVVALAILSLGLTSAIALFAAATAAHRTAIHRSQAADLAASAVEIEVRQLQPGHGISGHLTSSATMSTISSRTGSSPRFSQ